jgi:hypothetical protein
MSVEHITLDQAKEHLRVLHDFEDDLIESLIKTALRHIVTHYLDRQIADDFCQEVDDAGVIVEPRKLAPPLIAAAKLVIGDLYANREAQSQGTLTENMTVVRLCAPYRRMGV